MLRNTCPERSRRVLRSRHIITAAFGLLIVYLCAFKLGNTDFWWHVKAGQIMRESGWIHTDPFAFTRVGQAYVATHEWLAQVMLSQFYDRGGTFGISALRTILVLLTFGIPLLLHRKNMWVNGALAVIAAVGARPALTDRPQLFTFLMFSLVACLCVAYLDANDKKRRSILYLLPVITILWSNLHGAASITGIALFGALFVQRLFLCHLEPSRETTQKELSHFDRARCDNSEWKSLLVCLVAMCVAPMVSPNGVGNITYLIDLFTDKSAEFIVEWQPASWDAYLKHTGLLWIAAVGSLLAARKHLLFSILTLVGIGYLSRSAGRHEILFTITALVLTVYQLKHLTTWNATLDRIASNKASFISLSVGLIVIIGTFTYVRSYDINRNDHLFGYGQFQPMRGASEFIHSTGVTGNMFNNYNAGGELLFHDHKVYLDGRNLDYDYDYINKAINAGVDSTLWNQLDLEHKFSHVVIYYDLQAELMPMPYTDMLDADEGWFMTYLDDWAVVYERAVPGKEIRTMTPRMLHHQHIPERMTGQELQLLESDLKKMIDARPDGVKPRLYLAKLYTALQGYGQAKDLLEEAIAVQPKNYLVHLGFMKLAMEQGDWDSAYDWVKKAKRAAGFSGLEINQELIDKIKSKRT